MVLATTPVGGFLRNSPNDKFDRFAKVGMAPPLSPLLVSLRSIVGDATVSTESGRSALRGKLKARLEKASVDELRQTASSTIGGDPIDVNPGFAANSSTARRVLIDTLVERIGDGAIPHPEEEDEDALPSEVLDYWLSSNADEWPEDAPGPPPTSSEEALDPSGLWAMAARGVEVKPCAEACKGQGAFATRDIAAGAFVGLYWGERLTSREYAVRHGWRNGELPTKLRPEEIAADDERRARLASLTPEQGAPMGGVDNGGSYIFAVLMAACEPEALPPGLGRRPIYVDAEDGTRSGWSRYINHAHFETSSCNLEPRTCPLRALVWFVARRDIQVGEELCFSYGQTFNAWLGKEEGKGAARDWHATGAFS